MRGAQCVHVLLTHLPETSSGVSPAGPSQEVCAKRRTKHTTLVLMQNSTGMRMRILFRMRKWRSFFSSRDMQGLEKRITGCSSFILMWNGGRRSSTWPQVSHGEGRWIYKHLNNPKCGAELSRRKKTHSGEVKRKLMSFSLINLHPHFGSHYVSPSSLCCSRTTGSYSSSHVIILYIFF